MKVKSAVGLLVTMALIFDVAETMAADRRVSGIISKIECGDGTDLSLRLTNRKIIAGVCFEKWCEALCGDRMEAARNRTIGKRISASVRVVNMEEAEEGVLSNEFYNINFD